jgi:hypothetical protein
MQVCLSIQCKSELITVSLLEQGRGLSQCSCPVSDALVLLAGNLAHVVDFQLFILIIHQHQNAILGRPS